MELQLLWVTPALLLRMPPDEEGKARPQEGREAGSTHIAAMLRRRATLAENGEWITLLTEYLA